MAEEVDSQCADGRCFFPFPHRQQGGRGKGVSKGMSGNVGETSTPVRYIKCLEAL